MKYLLLALVAIVSYKATQWYYMTPQVQYRPQKLVPYEPKVVKKGSRTHRAMIRIKGMMDGHGMCSATVISDAYALTAAHCVVDNRNRLVDNTFDVYDEEDTKVDIKAEAVALDLARDIALVKSDFSDFYIAQVESRSILPAGMDVMSCGFGADGYPACVTLKLAGNMVFRYVGTGGLIFQGFSGGPLLAENPNGGQQPVIIGVNSAVVSPGVLFGPIHNFEALWKLPKK